MDREFMRSYLNLAGELIAREVFQNKKYRRLEHIADEKAQVIRGRLENCSSELNQLFEVWLDKKMQYESCLMEEFYLYGAIKFEVNR